MGNYAVELCPIINRGKAISKGIGDLPSVSGYEIPLMPVSCDLDLFDGWKVPLMPVGECPYPITDIVWNQGMICKFTPFGTVLEPADEWVFCCTPPQGLFEGRCHECFARSTDIWLVGNLGFSAGAEVSYGQQVTWKIKREDLPLPGEALFALAAIHPGSGDAFLSKGKCAIPCCDALGSDCVWLRKASLQTSGLFLPIAYTFFATPTWTGGVLKDYYTEDSGWADMPSGTLSFPPCSVYGDPTLMYKISAEGITRNVTSLGFAGYSIGSHVFLKKLGMKYSEPFTSSCLGVDTGSPAKFISGEVIGTSIINSLTPFSPPLTQLAVLPIDKDSSITIITSYDVPSSTGWITKVMTVNVNSEGYCYGDCLEYIPGNPQGEGGILDIRTGVWLKDIVWANIPNADRFEDKKTVIQIVCSYTKKEEECTDVVIAPWHIMGMGG